MAAGGTNSGPFQGGKQFFGRYRLGEEVMNRKDTARLFVLNHGDHDDRSLTIASQAPDVVQHLPPAAIREEQIQGDGGEASGLASGHRASAPVAAVSTA